MSDELSAHGVAVGVPAGWEAEIEVLGEETADVAPGALRLSSVGPPSTARVLLHLANFALPPDRGDYGSGAVEIMDAGSVLIILLEFDRASSRTALFAEEGIPRRLRPDDFSTDALQRPQRNQAGAQRFFHVGDRAFCLYVVLGSHRARTVLVAEANRLLDGLRVL